MSSEELHATYTVSSADERIYHTAHLSDSLDKLKGVSTKRQERFAHLGITTVFDLLMCMPRRYLDFTQQVDIAHAAINQTVTIVARIDSIKLTYPKPRLSIFEMFVVDKSAAMRLSFFRQPWLAKKYHVGDVVALSGKVAFSYGFKTMNAPLVEVLMPASSTPARTPVSTDAAQPLTQGTYAQPANMRVMPIYAICADISMSVYRAAVKQALAQYVPVVDWLPSTLIAKHQLLGINQAFLSMHAPRTCADVHHARRRFAYEELLYLQLALRMRHVNETGERTGFVHNTTGPCVERFLRALPFSYTTEQQQCADELLGDMAANKPMLRLLLGDVGTGKTAVCALGMAACCDTHTQAALMAPTVVLASQYTQSIGPLLDAAHISWALLTSATPSAERARICNDIARGAVTVVFGTVALLSKDIQFSALSYIIIDEQHRFGVHQREELQHKAQLSSERPGHTADVLMMSATPVPRSLALSLYGDMAVSRICHKPHAGATVTTHIIPTENLFVAYSAMQEALSRGEQCYIICPSITESSADSTTTDSTGATDATGARAHADDACDVADAFVSQTKHIHAAQTVYEQLLRGEFSAWRIGLLTGALKTEDKERVMEAFRAHEIDVLVATTIVEVGVDVPNANTMLILDADRFGLATLHQLRGRVGRGSAPAQVFMHCAARPQTPARTRLAVLEHTNDGFELAQRDLELRSEGEILGYKQSGVQTLTFCDMVQDIDLIEAARVDADEIIEKSNHHPSQASAPTAPLPSPTQASHAQPASRASYDLLWAAVRRRFPEYSQ